MGATTSIKIPIRDDATADDIEASLCDPFIFERYREDVMTVRKITKHLLLFKREIIEEVTKSYGTKRHDLRKNISDVMNGGRKCVQLGSLNKEVYNELVECLKVGGDTGDWQPWEVWIEKPCIGQWGDDSCEINNHCLSVSGYGNPIGSGVDYARAIFGSPIMNKIINAIGRPIEGVMDSNCAIAINGRTVVANLDC